jgi:hypothetical protein
MMPDQVALLRLRQKQVVEKTVCAGGFDALVKRLEKCINVGGGYVFSSFEYHMFRIASIFDLLTDSPSYFDVFLWYWLGETKENCENRNQGSKSPGQHLNRRPREQDDKNVCLV